MNRKLMQNVWLASMFAFTLAAAGAAWAAEHPTGGAEHPSAASAQKAAPAQAAASGATAITGEVVDLSCYMAEGASGKAHKKCAKACLVGGGPAGLLTSDGSVVLLFENHKKAKAYKALREFAGDQAKVTGTPAQRGGIKALSVDSVEAAK